jgi:hypothetical protein
VLSCLLLDEVLCDVSHLPEDQRSSAHSYRLGQGPDRKRGELESQRHFVQVSTLTSDTGAMHWANGVCQYHIICMLSARLQALCSNKSAALRQQESEVMCCSSSKGEAVVVPGSGGALRVKLGGGYPKLETDTFQTNTCRHCIPPPSIARTFHLDTSSPSALFCHCSGL